MEELLKTKLLELAKRRIAIDKDDFDLFDFVGSNIDDAYDLGVKHGEVLLARELLDLFCIKY